MKNLRIPISWLCYAIRLGVVALFGLRLCSIASAYWDHADFKSPDLSYEVKNIYIGELEGNFSDLPVVAKLTSTGLQLPALLMLAYGLYRLFKLLRGFEHNDFFGSESTGHLRAFATALLISSLLVFAEPPLQSLVFSWMQWSKVQNYFVVGFFIQDFATPLLCALFYLIARAMEEGQRLAQENREFI